MQNIQQLNCQHHDGYQIEMLDIGKSTQTGLRTLCQMCFEQTNSKNNVIFMKHFYEKLNQQRDKEYKQIEAQQQEYHAKLSPLFKYIEEAQDKCIKVFTFVKEEFSQFQQIFTQTLNKTLENLKILGENPTISQLQQLAEKIGKGDKLIPIDFSDVYEKVITDRQQNTYKQLINKLQDIFKEIRKVFYYLDNKKINEYRINHGISINQYCQAISANCFDSLLATSEDKVICIWKLDNYQFEKIEQLNGHQDKVTCIQFSKQQNWFISGSDDFNLKIWKINQDRWCCTQTLEGHQNYISDIKLSEDENTIISSSFDFKIKVWQQKDQKGWICSQTLDNHKKYVYYLSMNRCNTLFVSSSADLTLKFWQIKNKKWENFYTIEKKQNEQIKRICFLNENQIACQVLGFPKIIIIQIIGNNEINQMQEIPLKENDDEFSYNPMIYFQKKKILIFKNNKKIIILRENNNGLFQLINQIDGNYQSACLISSGQSLIMFEKDKKQLQLFKAY